MSANPLRLASALALAATLALGVAGCFPAPYAMRPITATPGPGPVIEGFTVSPSYATKDAVITFSVSAKDRDGKPLKYEWTTGIGTLSATTGSKVTWRPVKQDGTLEPAGMNSVTVVVSNGKETNMARKHMKLDGQGGVTVILGDELAAPAPAATATPGGATTGSPAPGASPSASTPVTGSPAACRVGAVSPSLAAPGTVFTIAGAGFEGDVAVTVGGRTATVLAVKPDRITAQVPAEMTVSDTALKVSVTSCGETKEAEGTLTIADLDTMAGTVAQAGRGLLATVYALEPGTDELPADLEKRKSHSTYYASTLDLRTSGFSGFPGASGVLENNFAIRFTGELDVTQAGATGFMLSAVDGAKLYVDGKLVVDGTGGVDADGQATLTAGKHAVRVDYFQGDRPGGMLQLYWTPPGGRETLIPATAFSLP